MKKPFNEDTTKTNGDNAGPGATNPNPSLDHLSRKELMLTELIEDLKRKAVFDDDAIRKLDLIKNEASEAVKQATLYEKQIKHVENFTNSYSQKSFSNFDMNNTSAFKSMMNMLEDLYENEDVLNTTKVYHNFKESNLHFCLMFASPLVIFRETLGALKLQTIPWEIEYNKDLTRIKKTLKNVGCDIKFLSAKASVSTFVDVMKKNPMILHFCGHGIDNTRGAKAARSMEENIDNYYLLFEDHLGRGELVSVDLLTSMISSAYKVKSSHQNKNSLEFVFVASCHSEVTAQVFLTAGASHVVCVSKDEKISDDICNTFAEYYYQAFFCESLTFCEAFESAKRKVAAGVFFNGEEKKFKMLLNSTYTGRNCHRCTRFISKPSPASKFIDFTPVPLFHFTPFLHECFLGRNREIYEIIDLLYHNRFVVLKGMIGVGKSSLQKEIANKLSDRGMFEHGIVYIDLKSDTSLERMLSVFMADITISKLVRRKSGGKDYDLQQAAGEIAHVLADYHVLLVFDNVDSLYVRASHQLKLFFESLITHTKGVKIFISLFSKIDNIQGNFSEKVYELGPLTDHDAAQLLLKRATRRVNEVEILQLFNEHHSTHVGKPALESHKLIKLLNGMPQLILMAASILHERNLSDLYTLLTSTTAQYQLRPLISEAGNHHLIENSVSLALDIVEQLGETENLNLVTYFPAGVLDQDLGLLWGDDFQTHLQRFISYSILYKNLLVEEINYYTVNGFMLEHFAVNFNPTSMAEHIEKLTEVFCNKLKMYFMKIGTLIQKKKLDLFTFEEVNIRCFYNRLKEYYKNQGWDTMEGITKGGTAGSHRKIKLMQFAANIIEKNSGSKPAMKSVGYQSTNDRKTAFKNHSSNLLLQDLLMINEEVVEEEGPGLEKEEAPLSSRGKKKETEKMELNQKYIAPKKVVLQVPNMAVAVKGNVVAEEKKLELKPTARKAVPEKESIVVAKRDKAKVALHVVSNKAEVADKDKKSMPNDTRGKKDVYTGPFSKAYIPKKEVEGSKRLGSSMITNAYGYPISEPLEQKKAKHETHLRETMRAPTARDDAKEAWSTSRKSISNLHEDKVKAKKKLATSTAKKIEPESSEDAPPKEPHLDLEDEEDEDDLETVKVKQSEIEVKGSNGRFKSGIEEDDDKIDLQTSLNLDKIEFSQDISSCLLEESLTSPNPKKEIFDLGRFDEEVTGEIIDPIEKRLKKTIDSDKLTVSVFSDNIADAILNIDEDKKTLSSEEGSADPFSENELRNSLHSCNLEVPLQGFPQQQSMFLAPQVSNPLSHLAKSSVTNLQQLDTQSNVFSSHQTRKSSISQYSYNTDLQESPQHTTAPLQPPGPYSQLQFSNNSFNSQAQPELVKRSSKQKMSNTTSSVVSRDSSSKLSTVASQHGIRGKNSIVIPKLISSNKNPTQSTKYLCQSYEDFTRKCGGHNNELAILYCSILVLSKRNKESVKEINYHFNLGILNDDLQLVGQMARLKAMVLIETKKIEDASKFLALYKDIAILFNSELGTAIANFGLGHCRLIQNDLQKAKMNFGESQKRYNVLDHLFGKYYSIRNLFKINMKEKKEKEIKELQEKMKLIHNSTNLKDCVHGVQHKKGIFISRRNSEILSILIEYDLENRELKEKESYAIKKIFKQAVLLAEEFCKPSA